LSHSNSPSPLGQTDLSKMHSWKCCNRFHLLLGQSSASYKMLSVPCLCVHPAPCHLPSLIHDSLLCLSAWEHSLAQARPSSDRELRPPETTPNQWGMTVWDQCLHSSGSVWQLRGMFYTGTGMVSSGTDPQLPRAVTCLLIWIYGLSSLLLLLHFFIIAFIWNHLSNKPPKPSSVAHTCGPTT
jgi:hypothetical protein